MAITKKKPSEISAETVTALSQKLSVLRIDDTFRDTILGGFQVTKVSALNASISAGTCLITNKRITTTAVASKTFTASKDTYCYVNVAGELSYIEVAIDGALPVLPSNSMLFSIVRTDGTEITRVDSLNNNFRLGGGNLLNLGVSRYNLAIGIETLMNNQADNVVRDNGLYNTAIGIFAMRVNTTGSHNTAIGFSALRGNTTGISNTAIGEDALLSNTAGSSQVAIGSHAGQYITGNANTLIGDSAGTAIWGSSNGTTDRFNVVVGAYAGFLKTVNAGPFDYSIALGHKAYIDESYLCQLGGSNLLKVRTVADYETTTVGKGYIVKSPNGTRYRITASDAGEIVLTSLT